MYTKSSKFIPLIQDEEHYSIKDLHKRKAEGKDKSSDSILTIFKYRKHKIFENKYQNVKESFFFPWRTSDGTNQLPGQTQDHHKKYTRMRKHRHWNASKFPYRMSFLRFCRCPNYSLLHFTKPALQHLWLGYKLRQLLTKHTTLLGPR